MTIAEHKTRLTENLRSARERKAQLSEMLEQIRNTEQQLMGALAILEQMEAEAAQTPAPSVVEEVEKKSVAG